MKKLKLNNYILFIFSIAMLACTFPVLAQEEEKEEAEKPEKIVQLRYFNEDNSLQYLLIESVLKTGKKTEARPGVNLQVYLDSVSSDQLIAKLNTGKTGKSKAFIPPALKSVWDSSPKHSFIVVEEPASKEEEETTTTFTMERAKLTIDTSYEEGTRSITVNVLKLENGEWLPANEVEMKVGVQRLGGILTGGTDETYTTDSSGAATVEFTKAGMPGNEKGDIVLVARVDNNELYGNLLVKKIVPWGTATVANDEFFKKRSLWATRDKAPIWLMVIAYSIIAAVWAVLVYLIIQLFKIRKLGKDISTT
jgi:hypothetical protein